MMDSLTLASAQVLTCHDNIGQKHQVQNIRQPYCHIGPASSNGVTPYSNNVACDTRECCRVTFDSQISPKA
jgi:hypothetical protein